MYKTTTKVRVRYSETDKMGFAYYGNYATYFEIGRVEAIRELGFSYREMEDNGIGLPVLDFSIKYIKPAYYDDELTIETSIEELPKARIKFDYKTYNQDGVLLNKATTTLVFFNNKTNRPCIAPSYFLDALIPYFQ